MTRKRLDHGENDPDVMFNRFGTLEERITDLENTVAAVKEGMELFADMLMKHATVVKVELGDDPDDKPPIPRLEV